ncbi:ATP-dependent metallopeptidase FtsH/Yme1/Tma family protein [Dubosiella newyorkensis]|uniref:ATP-dependent metallopeptidase FtsH/Yme1/Tma family protein n=1 Tax=Dubosiella newyorkensis TaxID=1862672 RepID=UPI003F66D01D
MNKQKKSLYNYYLIALIVVVLLNWVLFPFLSSQRIKDESYSTFLDQVEERKVDKVQIQDNTISYTPQRRRPKV